MAVEVYLDWQGQRGFIALFVEINQLEEFAVFTVRVRKQLDSMNGKASIVRFNLQVVQVDGNHCYQGKKW